MYHSSAIPTPPFSPNLKPTRELAHGLPEQPLDSTLELLDSLVSFYHQERIWVCKARASLEEATKTSDSAADQSYEAASPASTTTTSSSSDVDFTIKSEADSNSLPGSPLLPSRASLWSRRKRGFNMRLDRLSTPPPNRRSTPPYWNPNHSSSLGSSQTRERILEMFEKMMEARMESCERVNRLVRNANRVDLYSR